MRELDDLVGRYLAGAGLVDAALAGITEAELDRRPPGEWSAREVVHHLADSETNSYVRLRRLLAEPPGSTIEGYDEAEWARVLRYDRPIGSSLAVFRAVRASTGELLADLTDADLTRAAVHTESGAYTLADWLAIYAAHAEDHAAQITAAPLGILTRTVIVTGTPAASCPAGVLVGTTKPSGPAG